MVPDVPQGLSDFAAGFGDTLSLGATALIRENFTMAAGSTNYFSTEYLGGAVTGAALYRYNAGTMGGRKAWVRFMSTNQSTGRTYIGATWGSTQRWQVKRNIHPALIKYNNALRESKYFGHWDIIRIK